MHTAHHEHDMTTDIDCERTELAATAGKDARAVCGIAQAGEADALGLVLGADQVSREASATHVFARIDRACTT